MNKYILELFMCPACRGSVNINNQYKGLSCNKCDEIFPVYNNNPILLNNNNTIFPKKELYESLIKRKKLRIKKISKYLPKISINLSSEILDNFFHLLSLSVNKINYILVIGSGSQKLLLDKKSYPYENIKLIYSDIDPSSTVDLYCDAHELPFKDSSLDGIIITAVIEHVLYPEIVASEITRVLKNDGLLYSEIPFMQQVHEGAYDFTRYTLSGHRRLFNSFTEIDAGMVAGPGTVLSWSIEHFFLSFFKINSVRNIIKLISRIFFFWLKYFDILLKNKKQAIDGASCTYFLGSKVIDKVKDENIIKNYRGSKKFQHKL